MLAEQQDCRLPCGAADRVGRQDLAAQVGQGPQVRLAEHVELRRVPDCSTTRTGKPCAAARAAEPSDMVNSMSPVVSPVIDTCAEVSINSASIA